MAKERHLPEVRHLDRLGQWCAADLSAAQRHKVRKLYTTPRQAIPIENIWQHSPEVRIVECRRIHLREWQYADMSAPFWRLYWNDRTGACVTFKEQTLDLKSSRMLLIPPYMSLSSTLFRPVNHYCIHFVAGSPYETIKPRFIAFPAKPELVEIVKLLDKFEADDDLQKAHTMMALLYVCHYALSLIPKGDLTMFYADRRVQAVVNWMEKHLDQPIANDTLARVAGMDPSGFVRLFRACTGQTPQACLRAKRINRASLLLDTTNASIDEIAAQTGFYDRFYFTRVFHAVRHISPAAFRKRHRL